MDPALKPTGDEPGGHSIPIMAEPLLPTFNRESRSSPALHTALLVIWKLPQQCEVSQELGFEDCRGFTWQ